MKTIDAHDAPSILKALVSLLENNEDARVHEACEMQLRRMFSTLPSSNSILSSAREQVDSGIHSASTKLRHRSVTLLKVFADSLDLGVLCTLCAILLADPDGSVASRALDLILDCTPKHVSDSVIAVLREISDKEDKKNKALSSHQGVEHRIKLDKPWQQTQSSASKTDNDAHSRGLNRRRRTLVDVEIAGVANIQSQPSTQSQLLWGNLGINRTSLNAPICVPIPDVDPLNLKYLSSNDFLKWIRMYNLDEKTIRAKVYHHNLESKDTVRTQMASSNAQNKINKAQEKSASEEREHWKLIQGRLTHSELITLCLALFSHDPTQGRTLNNKIHSLLQRSSDVAIKATDHIGTEDDSNDQQRVHEILRRTSMISATSILPSATLPSTKNLEEKNSRSPKLLQKVTELLDVAHSVRVHVVLLPCINHLGVDVDETVNKLQAFSKLVAEQSRFLRERSMKAVSEVRFLMSAPQNIPLLSEEEYKKYREQQVKNVNKMGIQ